MQRLCERPGCSEVASVAYGMRAEDLVFWLDTLSPSEAVDAAGPSSRGALCRRHADSMVVPRNWVLDDLRDPDLHLFRPPPVERGAPPVRRRRSSSGEQPGEQLELGVDPDQLVSVDPDSGGPASEATAPDVSAPEAPAPEAPWTPSFDVDDDLGGLLAARSPLLARAFRGSDRPDRR